MDEWDPYQFQVPREGEGVVPRAILVMLLVLVGMLEFLAAGSKTLIAVYLGGVDHWVTSSLLLSLIGLSYFALARGVWALRSWVPLVTALLTLLVLMFGLLRFTQDSALDLALALILFLAIGTNLAVLAWAYLPETRIRLEASDGAVPADDRGNPDAP